MGDEQTQCQIKYENYCKSFIRASSSVTVKYSSVPGSVLTKQPTWSQNCSSFGDHLGMVLLKMFMLKGKK